MDDTQRESLAAYFESVATLCHESRMQAEARWREIVQRTADPSGDALRTAASESNAFLVRALQDLARPEAAATEHNNLIRSLVRQVAELKSTNVDDSELSGATREAAQGLEALRELAARFGIVTRF